MPNLSAGELSSLPFLQTGGFARRFRERSVGASLIPGRCFMAFHGNHGSLYPTSWLPNGYQMGTKAELVPEAEVAAGICLPSPHPSLCSARQTRARAELNLGSGSARPWLGLVELSSTSARARLDEPLRYEVLIHHYGAAYCRPKKLDHRLHLFGFASPQLHSHSINPSLIIAENSPSSWLPIHLRFI
jgi:hypothetical protein